MRDTDIVPRHGEPAGRGRRERIALGLIGAALVALVPAALAAHGRWDADYGFVAVVLTQCLLYVIAARRIRRIRPSRAVLAIVLAVAALLRLSLLFEDPLHSTDVYRYVWDGRVQAEGINPYRYVPADPALSALRDQAIYPNINRADYAVTIYPPAAQIAFRLFTRFGESLLAVKLGWLVLEAAMMVVLARLLTRAGRSPAELLLYAWHPLPVWEIAGDGHVDAGMAAFLIFALASWAGRHRLLTGALLAVSVLFKPMTLAALPAFWRPWDWRVPVALLVTAILAYLPYTDVGTDVLGFLPRYVGEEGIGSGGGFIVLQALAQVFGPLPRWTTLAYLTLGAIVLSALSFACIKEPRTDPATTAMRAQVLVFAFLLVLSANYSWYFLVLVPLGCLAPWMPARALTLLGVVLHAAGPVDGYPRAVLIQSLLYGTVMIAVAWNLYTDRHRRPQSLSRGPEA